MFFFQIIFEYIFSRERPRYKNIFIALLIIGFLDNFGVNGGKNGFIEVEAIGKSDTPFAILFFLTTLCLYDYSVTKTINKNEIFILSLMSLFAFQFRIFGFIALVYYLFVAFNKRDIVSFKNFHIPSTFFNCLVDQKLYYNSLHCLSCFLYLS